MSAGLLFGGDLPAASIALHVFVDPKLLMLGRPMAMFWLVPNQILRLKGDLVPVCGEKTCVTVPKQDWAPWSDCCLSTEHALSKIFGEI